MDKEEKIKFLQELIEIPTVNGNEQELAEFIKRTLKKHHIDSKIIPYIEGRANIIVEIGDPTKSKKVLAFTGHLDTVTIGNRDLWHLDPFGGTIKDNRIYGRGASDMKSGLAAMIITLIELSENKIPINGTLRLIGTVGEELGAQGSKQLAKEHYVDDVDWLIVGEPTNGNIVFAHSGSINYEVISHGKSAHSSRPNEGINAITNLVTFINSEKNLFETAPIDPDLGKVVHSVTVINGGTQVNTIPDQASLKGNIRPTASYNNESVLKELQELIDKLNDNDPNMNLELKIIHNFKAVKTDKKNPLMKEIQKAHQNVFGKEAEFKTINGATDASDFTIPRPDLPVAVIGPGDWLLAHATNEFVDIDNFLNVQKVYENLAKQILN